VSTYVIPTDYPEADGTFAWSKTTMVLVEAGAGDTRGLGYADAATARLVVDTLAPVVRGRDPMGIAGAWVAMVESIRNLGRPGVASMAIAAVDCALWDLKARLLGLPLVTLLGAARDRIPGASGARWRAETRRHELRSTPTMNIQLTLRGLSASDAVRLHVEERVTKLLSHNEVVIAMHVAVEAPHHHHHHRHGHAYRVRIEAEIPGTDIVISPRDGAAGHTDLHAAIDDAFVAAERRLREHARIRRGVVKSHAESWRGARAL
jgi:ribosomal subunit interface protein